MNTPTARKKLGPFLLSGLMIGPILGSGIIFLPPLVYQVMGNWALVGWMFIVGLSYFFATIFGKLSILLPGDAGVAGSIETAFGRRAKRLASFYLIGAVLFGPVPVLLTAARFLHPFFSLAEPLLAMIFLGGCVLMLLRQVSSIGRISFVMSSLVALTLVAGATVTLILHSHLQLSLPPFSRQQFGSGLLLLFWTMVGWEVVGNYSGDVRNPETTIPRAVFCSFLIIALVSLTVAAGVQMIAPSMISWQTVSITDLIYPLFGPATDAIMAVLVSSLCITSYLLFAGGTARLASFIAAEGHLPGFLAKKGRNGAPVSAILVLAFIHLAALAAVHLHLTDMAELVALADGFFIANSLIGIIAAIRLLPGRLIKGATVMLALLVASIFFHAGIIVISIILMMAVFCLAEPLQSIRTYRAIHKEQQG